MRTKEVEEAIKRISSSYDDNTGYYEAKGSDWCAVHRYIEELEKKIPTPSNEVPVEYQTLIVVDKREAVMKDKIRDKIKELYEDKDSKYYDMFLEERDIEKTISILKSIIGE